MYLGVIAIHVWYPIAASFLTENKGVAALEQVASTVQSTQIVIQEKSESQRLPLALALTSPSFVSALKAHATRLFSTELVLFLEAVQRLRAAQAASRYKLLCELHEYYLDDSAPHLVNLPSTMIRALELFRRTHLVNEDAYHQFGPDHALGMYNDAENEVIGLVKTNLLRSFVLSSEYASLPVQLDS